jgi:hypothetical protein
MRLSKISMDTEPPPLYGGASLSCLFEGLLVGELLKVQFPSKLIMTLLARLVRMLLGAK